MTRKSGREVELRLQIGPRTQLEVQGGIAYDDGCRLRFRPRDVDHRARYRDDLDPRDLNKGGRTRVGVGHQPRRRQRARTTTLRRRHMHPIGAQSPDRQPMHCGCRHSRQSTATVSGRRDRQLRVPKFRRCSQERPRREYTVRQSNYDSRPQRPPQIAGRVPGGEKLTAGTRGRELVDVHGTIVNAVGNQPRSKPTVCG